MMGVLWEDFAHLDLDQVLEKCQKEQISLFAFFSESISRVADKTLEFATIKSHLQMIVEIVQRIPIGKLIESPSLCSIYLDHVISLPAKISNSLQGNYDQIGLLLFQSVIDNSEFFGADLMAKFLKRIFILQKFDWIFQIDHEIALWKEFLLALSPVEQRRLAKEALKRMPSSFPLKFTSLLSPSLIAYLLSVSSFDGVSIENIVQSMPSQSLLWRELVKEFWSKKEFALESEDSQHEAVCLFLFLLARNHTFCMEAEVYNLFLSGVNFHLDSKCSQRRTIAMILAERITEAYGEKGANFDLDSNDSAVQKWRSILKGEMQIPTAVNQKPSPIISLPSEQELHTQLTSLKLRPPVFIGELIEVLQQKKGGATSIQTLFSFSPSIIEKCDRQEAKDHLYKLFTLVINLRDDYEMENFLAQKASLLSCIIKKQTISCVAYTIDQIFQNALSQGEKIFLLDMLCEVLLQQQRETGKLPKKEPNYSLSTQKVRYISFTSLQKQHTASSTEIDPFIYTFTVHTFFSLCRALHSAGKKLATIVFEKSILTCSLFLLHSNLFPDAHQMILEFSNLIAPLALSATQSKWSQKVILSCYYALARSIPAALCNEQQHYSLLVGKICSEIDSLLESSTPTKDIHALCLSTLQEFASKFSCAT